MWSALCDNATSFLLEGRGRNCRIGTNLLHKGSGVGIALKGEPEHKVGVGSTVYLADEEFEVLPDESLHTGRCCIIRRYGVELVPVVEGADDVVASACGSRS